MLLFQKQIDEKLNEERQSIKKMQEKLDMVQYGMNTQNRIQFAMGLQDKQKRQQSLSAEVFRKRSIIRSDESARSLKRLSLAQEAKKINISSHNDLEDIHSRNDRYKRIQICSSGSESQSKSLSPRIRNNKQSVKSFSELAFDQQIQAGKKDLRSPEFKKSPSNKTY